MVGVEYGRGRIGVGYGRGRCRVGYGLKSTLNICSIFCSNTIDPMNENKRKKIYFFKMF